MSVPLGADRARVDIALLARIVARDQLALGELYDSYSRLLFGLILRILKNRAEAEEVLQEVFVQAWTRANTYHPALGSPAGWLVGISRNRAIDRLRANATRARVLEPSDPQPVVDTPEKQAVSGERQRTVRRALDSLPPEQRHLIELAYYEGYTQAELAARTGIPLGTVKTRIRSGMQTLREQLDAAVMER